jgi:predicted GNAT family acetyltransferase
VSPHGSQLQVETTMYYVAEDKKIINKAKRDLHPKAITQIKSFYWKTL